ncbi:hypothetical protein KSX_92610 [Ktedonospora formicarum]|uniref:Uncharacterized protein n=1 Tax=Ktedonospora formicarum TaxID=2778364 RepID=A0A8J3IBT9_9CHLR|nr:hypothetical protein KSX_92610 [Ktedonospora formicarum]
MVSTSLLYEIVFDVSWRRLNSLDTHFPLLTNSSDFANFYVSTTFVDETEKMEHASA